MGYLHPPPPPPSPLVSSNEEDLRLPLPPLVSSNGESRRPPPHSLLSNEDSSRRFWANHLHHLTHFEQRGSAPTTTFTCISEEVLNLYQPFFVPFKSVTLEVSSFHRFEQQGGSADSTTTTTSTHFEQRGVSATSTNTTTTRFAQRRGSDPHLHSFWATRTFGFRLPPPALFSSK